MTMLVSRKIEPTNKQRQKIIIPSLGHQDPISVWYIQQDSGIVQCPPLLMLYIAGEMSSRGMWVC